MKAITMVKAIPLLTRAEYVICCNVMRNHSIGYLNAFNEGLLPFKSIESVIEALDLDIKDRVEQKTPGARICLKIRQTLRKVMPAPSETFLMYLNNGKVAHRLGTHPERGVAFTWLKRMEVTAGTKWSLGHQDYVPDTQMRAPVVALTCIKKGLWRVSCSKEYRDAVGTWLVDNLC